MTVYTDTDIPLNLGYKIAHEDAVLVDRSDCGMLKFTGETRLDLVNRMSTQNVINLQDRQGAATILTSDIGRMIDRLILYASTDSVYCLTGENNDQFIADYFMRFVFFMDDFQIENLSHETKIFAVYGRRSAEEVDRLFGPVSDILLHYWLPIEIQGITVYLHKTDPVAGGGFYISCESDDAPSLLERFSEAKLSFIDQSAYNYLRIESGWPTFGSEITADYIPLEAGLWTDVSFNKGCYTGQEIIARLESRGRLAKRLVKLELPEMVEQGTNLRSNGKLAGAITSIQNGPDGIKALGYVKSSLLEAGTPLAAGEVPVQYVLDA